MLLPLLAAAFIAEVIGTMAGFGSATVLTPFAALFLDMKTAIAVVAFFHAFGNAARLSLFLPHVNWRIFALFGCASIALAIGGAWLAAGASSALLKLLFGGFLLAFVIANVAAPSLQLPSTTAVAVIGGMGSGFIAGLLGTGGAIRSVFLTAFHLDKQVYIATSAMIALVVDSTRIPVYLSQGWLRREQLGLLGTLLAVAFAGAWVGRRLVQRVPQRQFRWFVLAMLGLMGVKLIIEGWRG